MEYMAPPAKKVAAVLAKNNLQQKTTSASAKSAAEVEKSKAAAAAAGGAGGGGGGATRRSERSVIKVEEVSPSENDLVSGSIQLVDKSANQTVSSAAAVAPPSYTDSLDIKELEEKNTSSNKKSSAKKDDQMPLVNNATESTKL
ncbi:uncharacterized protein LOC142349583 [Convolutriloba macropyga]|uniref:uncharacterized protein LOC142349583 n=1 Tax=Convolutriloba macropyga TaxID=536237 RepID=UPI003F51EC6F